MLDQRDSRHFLGSTNWVASGAESHLVVGKIFLAEGAVPLPVGSLERVAPRTITSLHELRHDLERTRARGYATAVDELEEGLWAVAAPVRDANGVTLAALSVSGPTARLRPGLLDELGRLVAAEAENLSTRIGYDDVKRGAA